ncbi:MAG: FimB/Mfa2 family fimbrial subunit, partial [Tannerellaceae bacterium]|nr:FimB/Mfa2 family fimbrial subunit [Tannerellaceae bacterium]
MRINRLNKIPVLPAGLIAFLLVFSCIHEEWNGVTPSVNEEAMVTVVIQSPGAGSASTRAITDTDEEDVKEIDVLVFEQTADGGEYVTTASCSDTDITTDPNDSRRKTFTVKLTQGDFDLVILANAHDIVSATDWTGYTKSQVLEALEAAVPATGKWPTNPFTPFPMWGDVGEITIDDNTNLTGENRIKITRMVARVDVKLSGDALLNFHLTSVDVYNYNTRGTLVPASEVWDAVNFKATSTTVPVSSTVVEGPLEYTTITGDAYCVQEIYLLESGNYQDAARTTPKGLLERTCLVVGGIWDAEGTNNFSGAPTYYRVDFCPTGTDLTQDFYDILRNHQYIFTITKVTGKGYDDSETAYKSAPVNIETEIVQWDEADMDDIWLDGQYYYSITPQESELWASASTGNEIYVKTDYPTWTFELSDLPTPGDPAADPSTLTWLTITSHIPGTTETGNGLRHTIRYDVERNTTGTSRVAYLHYSAGRFSTTVTITQYEWEIEDMYITPTGDIPPPGEVRTVTIEGVFNDIDVRVRDILDNVVLDTNTVPGSQTSSTAVLTIPSLWKEGSRILAFEFFDMLLADWSAFHTDRQQGYYVDIYTSHTDGNTIANQGEDFTIYVSGLWPDVYVRAVLEGTTTPLAGPVTIPAGSGSDNSQIISISANSSWTSRTIEFQKSMDGVNWEFMSRGIQSGYDVTVTTSHVAGAAITNTGQTFSITVAGASGSLYPAINVRAVVQGSETLVATTVTVPAGSGTNTAYTIYVDPNASWSSRAVELQWNRNGVWTAISSGQQGGYAPVLEANGTPDGDGFDVTVSGTGYAPALTLRAAVNDVQISVATPTLAAGT